MNNTIPYCIYRRPKTLELCCNHCNTDELYCKTHCKFGNIVHEIINNVVNKKVHLDVFDIYKIYNYIYDNDDNIELIDTEEKQKRIFLKFVNSFYFEKLMEMYEKYPFIKNSKNKIVIVKRIHEINSNTYRISKDVEKIIKIQKIFLSKKRENTISYNIKDIINKEDIFTLELIEDIPRDRLFLFENKNRNLYAFDVIELEYFIRNNKHNPYNPYTNELIGEDVIKNMEDFIRLNKLNKKNINNDFIWDNKIHAFTDLSIEIERHGFYNSPNWFLKFDRKSFGNVIKIFRDFSVNINVSHGYFKNVSYIISHYNESDLKKLIFEFCKEGIKLFRECHQNNYILLCNFMKALAMCSQDFYNNIPEWLLNTQTESRIMHNTFEMENFLFYYYVEYLE